MEQQKLQDHPSPLVAALVEAGGTRDGENRRERNRNGEVLKDSRDSQRKDKLITDSDILIHSIIDVMK